jgi:hypothetical protein
LTFSEIPFYSTHDCIVRAGDNKTDTQFLRQQDEVWEVICCRFGIIRDFGQAGLCSCISRHNKNMLHHRGLTQFPSECMFPSAFANEKYPQICFWHYGKGCRGLINLQTLDENSTSEVVTWPIEVVWRG